jgi:hypothetical protein
VILPVVTNNTTETEKEENIEPENYNLEDDYDFGSEDPTI